MLFYSSFSFFLSLLLLKQTFVFSTKTLISIAVLICKLQGKITSSSTNQWKKNKYYPTPPLLKTITAYNADKTKTLGTITFHCDQKKNGDVVGIKAVGSDARQVTIEHCDSSPIFLHKADAPGKPTVSYSYQDGRITRVEKPEGRIVTTEYNAEGKVAAQYAPV